MTTVARNDIRNKVLEYVANQDAPVGMRKLADDIRTSSVRLRGVGDSDFRDVVQPMIVTGKLSYAAGLTIRLGKNKK